MYRCNENVNTRICMWCVPIISSYLIWGETIWTFAKNKVIWYTGSTVFLYTNTTRGTWIAYMDHILLAYYYISTGSLTSFIHIIHLSDHNQFGNQSLYYVRWLTYPDIQFENGGVHCIVSIYIFMLRHKTNTSHQCVCYIH